MDACNRRSPTCNPSSRFVINPGHWSAWSGISPTRFFRPFVRYCRIARISIGWKMEPFASNGAILRHVENLPCRDLFS